MLTSHEKRNHHVRNLLIRDHGTILVRRSNQLCHDIQSVQISSGLALLNDIHVKFCDSSLSVVASAVVRQWSPWEGEVDWRETHIEIVVELGEVRVEFGSDLFSLQRVRRSVDRDLRHDIDDVENTLVALEVGGFLDKVLHFALDDWNIRPEGLGAETNLHKLITPDGLVYCISVAQRMQSYLLLLHQFRVGTIVDNISSKDRRCKHRIDLLGIDVLVFAVQDELIAISSQVDGRLLSQQNERETIAIFRLAVEEELVRIDTVGDGAADDREQVEHDRRLVLLLEEQLLQDVKDDGEDEEPDECGGRDDSQAALRDLVRDRTRDDLNDTHDYSQNECAKEFEKEGGRERKRMWCGCVSPRRPLSL